MTNEEKKKANKLILLIGLPVMLLAFIIAGKMGEKSVTDLNNYKGFYLVASENQKDVAINNGAEYYTCTDSFNTVIF